MPVWLLLLVMSLATYRFTRLVVRDDFPPVLWLRDRLAGGWRPLTSADLAIWWAGAPYPADRPGAAVDHPELGSVQIIRGVQSRYVRRVSWSPEWLADLITCPWCASGWIAAGLTAAVALTVGVPVPLLTWPAVWGAGALLASREWA